MYSKATFRIAVILAAVVAALWFFRSRHDVGRLRLELQAELQRQQAIERQSRDLERQKARRLAAASTKPPPAPSPGTTSQRKMDPRVAALIASPPLQIGYLAAKRARLEREYGPFFGKLGLAPASVDRLKALLMQREEQRLDLASAAPAALRLSSTDGQWDTAALGIGVGGNSDDPAVRAANRLMDQADRSLAAGVTELLGPEGYRQFSDYERSLPMRSLAEDVAGSLAAGASPLSSDQVEQLSQILAQASPSYVRGGSAALGQMDWDQAFQQAGRVLSPPQLAALKAVEGVRVAGSRLTGLVRSAASGQ